jgi:hypothetical protein
VFAPNHKLRSAGTALAIGRELARVPQEQAPVPGCRANGTGTDCCAAGASPAHDTSRIAWAKLMARVGEEFPFACPWVWWRHPTWRRRPAGAGSLRTGGSQAGEGRDGFARVKSAPHASLGEPLEPPPVSPARGPPTDWGELAQVHFRPGNLSGTDRRTARHRYPQPLTAFHATVRTASEKGGLKAGSSRREKPGLERG